MSKSLGSFIKSFISSITSRKLSSSEIERLEEELKISLVENDIAYELAENFAAHIVEKIKDLKFSILSPNYVNDFLIEETRKYLLNVLPSDEFDIISSASELLKSKSSFVVLFIGVNGSGKSTTLAKFAKLFHLKGFKPLIVCADTFRAGAIEQLKFHADALRLPFFSGKYKEDPASVVFDAIAQSEKMGTNVVLIDTAGRAQTNVGLMNELKKIKRVAEPDHTFLIVDSLVGNDAVSQARMFSEFVGFDSSVLTKFDADVKGGAAISVAYVSKKPVSYIGTGPGYLDLKPFSMRKYINELLSAISL